MSRRWALNASPIIALAEIGQIGLLVNLSEELLVPRAVSEEIRRGEASDRARRWLQDEGRRHVHSTRTQQIAEEITACRLGPGESAVLSWAQAHPGWEAIVDDRAARHCAASLGVPVRGTVGIFLLAKREGLLPQVRPALERAAKAGLYVDESLFSKALDLAGER